MCNIYLLGSTNDEEFEQFIQDFKSKSCYHTSTLEKWTMFVSDFYNLCIV